ncbi:MAG: tyrosine-type recombinase/integrase [Jatrophihabitans sp.]
MSKSSTVVVDGPLASYAVEIEERLAALGYAPSTRREVQLQLSALSRWLQEVGLPVAKLTDVVVEHFRDDCVGRGIRCPRLALGHLVRMLRSAGALVDDRPVQPATKRELLIAGYVDFLREERGLSSLSVDAYRSDVQRFLQHSKRDDVRGLTTAEVSRAVLRETFDHSPSSVRRFGVALRSFLQYCFVVGIVDTDLSPSALPVSGRRRSLLPKGLTPREVNLLLRACDRRRDTGRRDYAAMLLMMRLGLRASEVAGLTLEDIDWRAGVITVRGKGSRTDRLPLPVDVGEAITAYLRRGRPSTPAREVFVRSMPPRIALTRAGVTGLVLAASRRAGIGDVRAHRLRHTAACQMLRSGVPPVQIGEVLRHRSASSTAIYARVDIDRLRLVAQSWPIGGTS